MLKKVDILDDHIDIRLKAIGFISGPNIRNKDVHIHVYRTRAGWGRRLRGLVINVKACKR